MADAQTSPWPEDFFQFAFIPAMDDKLHELEQVLFRETGTLGVRRCRYERTKQPREETTVQTEWGPVRLKAGKPEYEDCARIARERNVPLREVTSAASRGRSDLGES